MKTDKRLISVTMFVVTVLGLACDCWIGLRRDLPNNASAAIIGVCLASMMSTSTIITIVKNKNSRNRTMILISLVLLFFCYSASLNSGLRQFPYLLGLALAMTIGKTYGIS